MQTKHCISEISIWWRLLKFNRIWRRLIFLWYLFFKYSTLHPKRTYIIKNLQAQKKSNLASYLIFVLIDLQFCTVEINQ